MGISEHVITNMVVRKKIEFYTPVNIHPIAMKTKEIDGRLDPTDVDIIACAVENDAVNLVTTDRKLVGNKSIEEEFGLRITHPKDLV